MIAEVLDQLPIFATQIGYRGDSHPDGASTAEETRLADALFAVGRTWSEVKPT